jgi:hypothetical protein
MSLFFYGHYVNQLLFDTRSCVIYMYEGDFTLDISVPQYSNSQTSIFRVSLPQNAIRITQCSSKF